MADVNIAPPLRACTLCCNRLPETADFFYRAGGDRSGFMARCRECVKVQTKAHREANRDRVLTQKRATWAEKYAKCPASKARRVRVEQSRRQADPEGSRQRQKAADERYYQRHRDRVKAECLRRAKERRQLYPEEIRARDRAYRKHKIENDAEFLARYRLRQTLHMSIKRGLKDRKPQRGTFSLLGYSMDVLRAHLERQFRNGMTWQNMGRRWHIDHIVPLSAFSYTTVDCSDFRAAWALTNLRPLDATENLRKGAKRTLLI